MRKSNWQTKQWMTMSAYVNINPTSIRIRPCRPLPNWRSSKIYVIGTDYVLGLWCSTPILVIFKLYRGCQFYWWRKPERPEKTTDYYDIILHRVHDAWAGFELTTSVVMGIDCIGSCSPNYHAITNKTERPDMTELLLRMTLNTIIPSM